MSEENKDFNESAEELKNIEVNNAEEVQIVEDTGNEITEEELHAKYEDILAKAKESGFRNRPYVKIMNEEDELVNPITRGNPYLNPFPNRSQRRRMKRLSSSKNRNNTQGTQMIVKQVGGEFLRYKVIDQVIPENTTPIFAETKDNEPPKIIGSKFHKARTIQHYVLATKFNLDNE